MDLVRYSLWHEARPAAPPPLGHLDRAAVAAVATVAVIETVVRSDLVWRPLAAALALLAIGALLWRRSRPLYAALLGWGAAGVLSALQLAVGTDDLGLHTMIVVLVLLYSVVRWGAGPEVVTGSAFVLGVAALGMYASSAGPAELLGGSLLLLLVLAVGFAMRYRDVHRRREQRELRNRERVALARELHDTVAHHVTAIAVQAQAGGVVAAHHPAMAAAVLTTIEAEASRALAEMRSMVRLLRGEEDLGVAARCGVADLPALARAGEGPSIEVSLTGSFTDLDPWVDAALYRLAQESLTNAARHARNATNIRVDVRRERGVVRLRVADDGGAAHRRPGQAGFGLRGMAERVRLLGGSFHAGPGPEGGWAVEAELPTGGPV